MHSIWDHTVLPATRHKWTYPALTSATQAGTRFTCPRGMEGWVDLVDLTAPRPGVEPFDHESDTEPLHHQDNLELCIGATVGTPLCIFRSSLPTVYLVSQGGCHCHCSTSPLLNVQQTKPKHTDDGYHNPERRTSYLMVSKVVYISTTMFPPIAAVLYSPLWFIWLFSLRFYYSLSWWCSGWALTCDRKIASSTPGRGAVKSTRSTRPSIPLR